MKHVCRECGHGFKTIAAKRTHQQLEAHFDTIANPEDRMWYAILANKRAQDLRG